MNPILKEKVTEKLCTKRKRKKRKTNSPSKFEKLHLLCLKLNSPFSIKEIKITVIIKINPKAKTVKIDKNHY